jgi:hypothetical protein
MDMTKLMVFFFFFCCNFANAPKSVNRNSEPVLFADVTSIIFTHSNLRYFKDYIKT